MTDSRANTPSVVERTRPVKTGAPVVGAHFLGQTAVFVLGEGALVLAPGAGEPRSVPVHDGAVLASAADAERIVTGGDDGKVVATDARGESTILAADAKQRWIDHVAVGPAGALAWSAGKEACVRTAKGSERRLEVTSTVGGLAFAPKGLRLAIAHYNGLTLWFANAQSEPERLQWKGSHLDVAVSTDGRFVITSMQEPTLHGWRLADRKDMRMSWRARHQAPRSPRSPGARPARRSLSAPRTARPASSISDDPPLKHLPPGRKRAPSLPGIARRRRA